MTKPVMPDDQESEYLSTQAIADYLATDSILNIDGIVFPSTQVDGAGLNVVFFHKASRCRELEFPKKTKFSAGTYRNYAEGPEPEYYVNEQIPLQSEKCEKENLDPFNLDVDYGGAQSEYDDRDITVEVILPSMAVHIVKAVEVKTVDFNISRTRWTKNENIF